MVVTSKALGLALLSTLALAAPFEDSINSLNARSADAIAEALLADEFEFSARDAQPEADLASEFGSEDLIAREAEFDFDFEEPVFEIREAEPKDDDDEKPKKKKKLSTKQKLRQLKRIKKALGKSYMRYRKQKKNGSWVKFAKHIPKSMKRMARTNKRLRQRVKTLRKSQRKLKKKVKSQKKSINRYKAFMMKNKLDSKFKQYIKERDNKKDKRDAIAEPEAWAMAEPYAYASPFAYAEAEPHPIPEAEPEAKDEKKDDKKKDDKKKDDKKKEDKKKDDKKKDEKKEDKDDKHDDEE